MKLSKAIEILQAYLRGDEPDYAPDLPLATRLSLEALKREKLIRRATPYRGEGPLPGETEEPNTLSLYPHHFRRDNRMGGPK